MLLLMKQVLFLVALAAASSSVAQGVPLRTATWKVPPGTLNASGMIQHKIRIMRSALHCSLRRIIYFMCKSP